MNFKQSFFATYLERPAAYGFDKLESALDPRQPVIQ
jgi:hypothetical protein